VFAQVELIIDRGRSLKGGPWLKFSTQERRVFDFGGHDDLSSRIFEKNDKFLQKAVG